MPKRTDRDEKGKMLPGHRPNLENSHKISPNGRMIRKHLGEKLYMHMWKYFDMPVEMIEQKKEDTTISVGERMLIAMFYKAMSGNTRAFATLAYYILGKPPESIHLQVHEENPFKQMSTTELLGFITQHMATKGETIDITPKNT